MKTLSNQEGKFVGILTRCRNTDSTLKEEGGHCSVSAKSRTFLPFGDFNNLLFGIYFFPQRNYNRRQNC